MGADRLFRDSTAEDPGSAMVVGDWRNHRRGISDEVHDGLLLVRDFGRSSADRRPAISGEPMVLGWDGAGISNLLAEPHMAGEAWIYLAAFSSAHSCS